MCSSSPSTEVPEGSNVDLSCGTKFYINTEGKKPITWVPAILWLGSHHPTKAKSPSDKFLRLVNIITVLCSTETIKN